MKNYIDLEKRIPISFYRRAASMLCACFLKHTQRKNATFAYKSVKLKSKTKSKVEKI